MARMKSILPVAMLVLLAVMTGSCAKKDSAAAPGKPSGKVEQLAQVGNQKITTTDLEQALANLPESYRAVASTFKGKRQILDNLIKKSLLLQEAEDRGFEKDEAVKTKIKDFRLQSSERIKQQIADLQKRLTTLDRQVFENVLLTELNERLKQDTAQLKQIPDTQVQSYYDDYVRKLKLLNPAAVAPKLEAVSDKIRAILVEEQLLQDLEKKHKVAVQEDLFRQHYAGEKDDVTIQDSTNQ
jgi:hypothetical protein